MSKDKDRDREITDTKSFIPFPLSLSSNLDNSTARSNSTQQLFRCSRRDDDNDNRYKTATTPPFIGFATLQATAAHSMPKLVICNEHHIESTSQRLSAIATEYAEISTAIYLLSRMKVLKLNKR